VYNALWELNDYIIRRQRKNISPHLLHLSSRGDFQQKQNQQYQIGLEWCITGNTIIGNSRDSKFNRLRDLLIFYINISVITCVLCSLQYPSSDSVSCIWYDDPDAKYEQYKIIPYSGLRNSAFEKELNAGHTNRATMLRPPFGMKIQHLPKGIREYASRNPSEFKDYLDEISAETKYLSTISRTDLSCLLSYLLIETAKIREANELNNVISC
ncbi:hypothetical protein PROFUN_15077, partial [Planoprotostelium fungivorum]